MSLHWQRISVPFDYPVHFTRDVLAAANEVLVEAIARREPQRRHRLLAVIDGGVARAWPDVAARIADYVAAYRERLTLADAPLVVPGGERAKNEPAALERLQARLHALGFDRQSVVVVIGGGAVLDMAGYAAATVHRGVRVVRVPTTVLAQADSGVNVKNGVNAFGSKNFLGTFAPPFAVVNDREWLRTLERRDVAAGMAEAVKVAVVRDAAFFDWLEASAGELAAAAADRVAALVERSARLHLAHIADSGDPFELGSARPLDFGHWAAHKLEMLTAHRLRHGEAVAIGMALDAGYAVEVGMLAAAARDRLVRLLRALGLPTYDAALRLCGPGERPRILDGLAEFREHLGGELCVTLPTAIGCAVEVDAMREDVLGRVIDLLARGDAAS
ncbi:MAG: 3-dehydroquinate synthase [Polyangiaceae bacterium UTPRO1]|jgi:3-dehydroquinate synthase|nr:MAG: 3-dehydroquinate synthase [Polyangiaceae bacterium UTPRO1]